MKVGQCRKTDHIEGKDSITVKQINNFFIKCCLNMAVLYHVTISIFKVCFNTFLLLSLLL